MRLIEVDVVDAKTPEAVLYLRHDRLAREPLPVREEKELVERVPSMTDNELKRIGERAEYYLFSSEDVYPTAAFGTYTAVSLAVVDVLEGASRELRRWDGDGILGLRNERFVV